MTQYVREGEFTATVYGMIKDQKFKDAIQVLEIQMQYQPTNRAALSLLGYCYYQLQNFTSAADMYEQLTNLFPEEPHYRMYYAQSMYKAGLFDEAIKQAVQIDTQTHPSYKGKLPKLQAAIKYGQDDLQGTRAMIQQCDPNDPDTLNNLGCILFKERKYTEATQKFQDALKMLGSANTLYFIFPVIILL